MLPEHWNGEIHKAVVPKCPNARAINESIEALFFKYSNSLRELDIDGRLAGKSVSEIKKLLTSSHKGSDKESLTAYFSRYAESRRTEKSREVYRYTLKAIRAFDSKEITFEKVNVIWLKAFDAHLEKQGAGINTRAIHFRNLRAVFNSAINEDLIGLEYYPFRKFKIASANKDKEALTEEQLQRLIAYEDAITLSAGRRGISSCCRSTCAGMNLVDLFHLDRLRDGPCPLRANEKLRARTSTRCQSSSSRKLQRSSPRYAGTDHVLRFAEESATYQTFNNRIQKAIRAIAQELNIEGLTFYWARYTWATLADKLGISEKEISKGAGPRRYLDRREVLHLLRLDEGRPGKPGGA